MKATAETFRSKWSKSAKTTLQLEAVQGCFVFCGGNPRSAASLDSREKRAGRSERAVRPMETRARATTAALFTGQRVLQFFSAGEYSILPAVRAGGKRGGAASIAPSQSSEPRRYNV